MAKLKRGGVNEWGRELESLRERVRELETRVSDQDRVALELSSSERRYHDLVETSPHVVWQLDAQGRITFLNRIWEEFTSYPIDEVLGRPFTDFQTPDEAARAMDTLAALLSNPVEEVRDFQTTFIRKDGRPVSFQVNARVLRNREGAVIGAQGTSVDITQRKRIEEEGRSRTDRIIRFQTTLLQLAKRRESDLTSGFAAIAGSAAAAMRVARVSVWMFTPDRSELVCKVIHDEVPDRPGEGRRLAVDKYPAYFRAVEENRIIPAADALEDPRTREFREEYLQPLRIGAMLDVPVWHGGRIEGIVCFEHTGGARAWTSEEGDFAVSIADAAALLLETRDRRRMEDQFRTISRAVEQSPSVVTITDPEGRILYVNPKFTEITGYQPEEVIGQNPRILKGDHNPPEVFRNLWQTVLSGQEWRGEFYNRKKNGEIYVEQASISPIRGADGGIVSIVKVAEDMTERKRMEEKLRREATIDALTGVFNRRHVLEHLQMTLEDSRRYRRPLSVCLCDIDWFKSINDTHGHHVGDEVLILFGKVLRESLRTVDLYGRYGGDEFLLIFPATPAADALISLERIRQRFAAACVDQVAKPVSCSATFGLAEYVRDSMDLKELVALADRALYLAKEQGRNRICTIPSDSPAFR
jgi:diguanylate cyclase (GGDEF)-like protein/PAS domain S-box-containing protein